MTPKAVPTIDHPQPDRRFLNHFEPRQRGHLANLFLYPVRDGITDPHRVVSAVRQEVLTQMLHYRRWGNLKGIERNTHIVNTIDGDFDEALDYASWAIRWESLSVPEKRRMKASKWMAIQKATEKQTKSLRSLGYHGGIESKLHASELIDRLLKGRTFV